MELSPHNPGGGSQPPKEPLFLPHTGIEYPFLKKRPQYIKEAPDFEMVHSGHSNMRFIVPATTSIQHSLGTRPSDFNARVVYDCTFGAGQGVSGSVVANGQNIFTAGGQTVQGGQVINGRYFEKLNSYYNLKSASDSTLIFESRFESGNLHRATQVGEFEYDLDLKFDHGAPTQMTQWFYFRVSNTRKN